MKLILPHLCTLILILPSVVSADDIFRARVAPILEHRCLSCHSKQEKKGDFSLQTRDELMSSGFVVAKEAAASHFLEVVVSADPSKPPQMPKTGTPLSPAEVQTLTDWIAAGAEWPEGVELKEPVVDNFDWWSFRPLADVKPPSITDAAAQAWIRTPIDAFVLQSLRSHQLQPSAEADRRTLIRRLTFDLIGLPPTPEEVDAFIADQDPAVYERLVDRLLASPQYGERWARHWLDVVRYADTCGYDKDKLRPNAWPYRDYVIRSFNNDKPYARFVQEQLAGDVLFPGEPDGILGLGFVASGPWDFIGHVEVSESKIDGKVARNLDRDDMVTGTLNTFCSVTIQCARCHNHKFDPFTQEHYYSLQSIFAAVDRAERPYDTDPAVERRRHELTMAIEEARDGLKTLDATIRHEAGDILTTLETRITELKPRAEVAPKQPEYGFHSEISAAQDVEKTVTVDLGRDADIRQIVLHACHDEFAGIGAGFGFPVRYRVEVASSVPSDAGSKETIQWLTVVDASNSDVANPGVQPVVVNIPESVKATLPQGIRFVQIRTTRLAPRQSDFIFALAEVEALDPNGRNVALQTSVSSLDSIEAPVRWSRKNLIDGIWPKAIDATAATELATANAERDAILKQLETPERATLRNTLQATLAGSEADLKTLPVGRMVYAAATTFAPQGNFKPTNGTPRSIHVLHRGNETQPGTVVAPGTIPLASNDRWQFDLPDSNNESSRRAALAQWVTRPENPLTWRSIVNRVWQYHFGRGLVESPNDFGRMGQLPSHPELLDWLAGEFLRNGQSIKSLHRLMVTSAVYRQVSSEDPTAETVDADNKYLWRMNRRRLEAEEIRDATLFVSGRLNPEMGGSGFYLFELEKTDHSPHYEYYKFNPDDPKSHRRSVYRFIVRSQPDPFMTTLDCADSSQSTPRRHETLTALQALSLLNNGFSIVMAEHFAERLKASSSELDAQIQLAFQLTVNRKAMKEELEETRSFANKHGLAALCRLLLNQSEFVFVD